MIEGDFQGVVDALTSADRFEFDCFCEFKYHFRFQIIIL